MQKKGNGYNEDYTTASIGNEIKFRVVFTLILTLRMLGNAYDIKGAFLHREFINEREMHAVMLQG